MFVRCGWVYGQLPSMSPWGHLYQHPGGLHLSVPHWLDRKELWNRSGTFYEHIIYNWNFRFPNQSYQHFRMYMYNYVKYCNQIIYLTLNFFYQYTLIIWCLIWIEIAYSATFSTAHGFFFLLNCRREQVYHNEAINAKHIDQTIFKRDIAYRTKFSTT